MKNTTERILLITDAPPSKKISGGSMTLQQIKFLLEEKHNVDIFLVVDPNINLEIDNSIIDGVNVRKFYKPLERWEEDNSLSFYDEVNVLKKELHKMIKENNYTQIWSIVQGETMIELTDYCRCKEKVKYVCQIWDDIEWWMKENKFSSARSKRVLKKYYKVIEGASFCITASWNMSRELNKIVKNKYIELMPALELPSLDLTSIEKNDDIITISMAGQVYAKKELDNFFTALDKIEWEIDGKPVYFHHYGSKVKFDLNKHKKFKDRIISEGFINQKVLLNKIATSDFLYCPYFFSDDEAYKKIAITSFPCKLITYLAVPSTVIMHAPSYSSPYEFVEKNKCAYLVGSNNPGEIAEILRKLKLDKRSNIIKNAKKAFLNNFTFDVIKNKFFKALNIKEKNSKRLKVLEINNVDLAGRRFNGYDIMQEINYNTDNICNQIVTYKQSNDVHVSKFYKNNVELDVEYRLLEAERDILSVHNVLSLTSNILDHNRYFKNSDVVHYHLVHNTKLSMCNFDELVSKKPTVITLHDPWWFTGRCVHPEGCEQWKKGCQKCHKLDTLFSLPFDNCKSLWKLKESIYKNIDAEIIVTTPFMKNCIDNCSMTNFKNVHIIPFGIDLEEFNSKVTKEEARAKFGVNKESEIVIFLRAQKAHKGTEYVNEALEKLETNKKITVLTCSEKHLLDNLKNKFEIIDLGNLNDEEVRLAFSACDMFLMPSIGESFGLMAIEAMASSKPIVVFNNTALPYVTHAPECGVLVENKNSTKLMEAIKMLIDNEEERKRRGLLGRKICEENYDVKEYNKKILEVYEKAMERQKNKKVIEYDLKIDYSKKDVIKLINKLRKVYKRLEFTTKIEQCELFINVTKDIDEDFDIDYSLEDVKKVIIIFNNFIYSVFEDEIVSNSDSFNDNSFKLSFIGKLKEKYRDKLMNHPFLFKYARKTYNLAKKIYRKIRRR